MNSRQLQYAVLLAEEGNFSQLAEKLNITQPALSKQILALEKELGVQLFNRSENPISLTAAGEHFVKEAKELLYKEEMLLRSMEQFKKEERGRVVIGTTPFRSAYLMPMLVKKLQREFPSIQVKLLEEGSEQLRKDVADGKFDFAVVNLPVDDSLLEVTPIEPDKLALVVPESLVEKLPNSETSEIAFKECASLPFAVVGTSQEMRILFEKLCASNGITPEITVEVVGLITAWEMACSGVAATLLPLQFIKNEMSNHPVKVIELKDETYLRQPAVVLKKGQYLSKYAKYAIELLTKMQ
ncbi:MAG: LysR family transcriptional regulator [Clostridia bacterium]|nr:LysR family transcriptional regulator [Clostridia bacterium]